MDELTFIGLTDDGTSPAFILSDSSGARFRLPIDARVAAALHQEPAETDEVELALDALTPRAIQSRIRAGESAADVAAAYNVDISRIQRFEGPVLQERAFVAQRARQTELRLDTGDTNLEQLLQDRLGRDGIGPDDIEWDAWRNEQGHWIVQAQWVDPHDTSAPAAQAHWRYEPDGRTIVAFDERGHQLIEATNTTDWLASAPAEPAEIRRGPERTRPRLVPVEDESVVEAILQESSHADDDDDIPPTAQSQPPIVSEESDSGAFLSRRRKKKAAKGRASVPSWDEILLGEDSDDSGDER